MKTVMVSKINDYTVYRHEDGNGFNLECNGIIETGHKLDQIIHAYIMFTEYFTVEEHHVVINKDNTGRELFNMIVSLKELKEVYNEAKKRY